MVDIRPRINPLMIVHNMDELRKFIRNCQQLEAHDHFSWPPLHTAVVNNRVDLVKVLLIRPDTDVNYRTREGYTGLLLACLLPELDLSIASDILKHGADPNIPNVRRVTPLHLACRYNSLRLLELLIRHRADVNRQDASGHTPLHYAVENNAAELIEYLLAHNADVNLKDLQGLNVLMFALYRQRKHAGLLLPYTQHLDTLTHCGWTALLFAINASDAATVRALLDRGASLAAKTCKYSALQLAAACGQYELFELVWQRTDLALETRNFMRFVCEHCPLPRCYQHFKLALNAPDVNWHVNEGSELFCHVFKQEPPADVDLEAAKGQYLDVIGWLLSRTVQLQAEDVTQLLGYFSRCQFAMEMWQMIFARTTPDITQSCILKLVVSQKYDVLLLFITYCLHLNPDDVLDVLDLDGIDERFLRQWLALFTAGSQSRHELVGRISYGAMKILSTDRVKSLLELSRDTVRQSLRGTCNTTHEFLVALDTLEIPANLKDVLRLRKPVNAHLLEDSRSATGLYVSEFGAPFDPFQ